MKNRTAVAAETKGPIEIVEIDLEGLGSVGTTPSIRSVVVL
jgi:hypothetical protein